VSRRRGPKPPEREPAMPGIRYIRVVCTGRGRHPEQVFPRLQLQAWPFDSGWRIFVEAGEGTGEFVTPSLRQKCRQCGHHAVLTDDNVQSVGAALAELSAAPTLDISLIPEQPSEVMPL
jgi:hypothetical protein